MERNLLPPSPPRASAAEAIYQALRDAITNGTLAPAERLREIHLSRHFGVSTTPVREALLRLSRDGLVEISPNRGAIVTALDRRAIVELYEVREVLEGRTVRLAALASARDFTPLENLLASAQASLDEPDQITFNRLDVEFHRHLNMLGGNASLAVLAEQVHRRIQGVRARCAIRLAGRPAISHAQHLALLAAVRARNVDDAEQVLREHIHSVRDAVLQVFADATTFQ